MDHEDVKQNSNSNTNYIVERMDKRLGSIEDAALEVKERVIRLEIRLDNLISEIKQHTLVDSKRLDLVEARVGKLERYMYMSMGVVSVVVFIAEIYRATH